MEQLQEKADAADLAKADAPKAEPEAAQKPLPKVSPFIAICLFKGITPWKQPACPFRILHFGTKRLHDVLH